MTIAPEHAPVPVDVEPAVAPPPITETVQDLRVTTTQADLAAAIKFVNTGLSSRTPMQALLCVKLEATDEGLTLSRTDFDLSTREVISAASGSGQALVPAATLNALLKKMDAGVVTLEVDGKRLRLIQDDLTYSIELGKIEDFPALPETAENIVAVMAGADLVQLARPLVAAGKDNTLPVLTGAFVETSEGTLTLACTDRYRLAVAETAIPASTLPSFLVPADFIQLASAQLKKSDEVELLVTVGKDADGFVSFTDGARTLTQRLLGGEFPKFRRLLPEEFSGTVTAPTADLLKAVDQVSAVCRRHAPVRFDVTAERTAIEGGGVDDDQASKVVKTAQLEGDEVTIAFNPDYIVDGVKSLRANRVQVKIVTGTRPAIFCSDETPGYRYLLMPVRL